MLYNSTVYFMDKAGNNIEEVNLISKNTGTLVEIEALKKLAHPEDFTVIGSISERCR